MARSNNVGIVIPSYNEEDTITDVVNEMLQYGDVIVVDDKSTDNTLKLVDKTAAYIVSHKTNQGYEKSLATGIEYAVSQGYLYIVTADADGELCASNINNIVNLLKSSSVVVGKRNKKNRFIEDVFGLIVGVFWGIYDPLCGMKGYTSNFYNKYGFFDERKMVGMELLAYAINHKHKVKQVSIDVKKREGTSRYGNGISSYLNIIRAMFLFLRISVIGK